MIIRQNENDRCRKTIDQMVGGDVFVFMGQHFLKLTENKDWHQHNQAVCLEENRLTHFGPSGGSCTYEVVDAEVVTTRC
jgi:hypothetical protein